jgi:hypothetical protein
MNYSTEPPITLIESDIKKRPSSDFYEPWSEIDSDDDDITLPDADFDGAGDVIPEVPTFDVEPQEIVQLEKDQRKQNDKLCSWFMNYNN